MKRFRYVGRLVPLWTVLVAVALPAGSSAGPIPDPGVPGPDAPALTCSDGSGGIDYQCVGCPSSSNCLPATNGCATAWANGDACDPSVYQGPDGTNLLDWWGAPPAAPDPGDVPDVQVPDHPGVGLGQPGYPYVDETTLASTASTPWDKCAVRAFLPVYTSSAGVAVKARFSQQCWDAGDVKVDQQSVTACLQYWNRASKVWSGVACSGNSSIGEGFVTAKVTGCISGKHSYRSEGFGGVTFTNGASFSSPVKVSPSVSKTC